MNSSQVPVPGCEQCGPVGPCLDHYKITNTPWVQEIFDRCKAENRKATPEEAAVLLANLENLADRALASLMDSEPHS